MKKADLARYRELLEAKEQELSEGFRTRERISLQRTSPEPEEEAQLTVEQDLAVQNRNQAAETLRQVWAALDRIAEGSFGICLSCDEEIQAPRLDAVPWTPYCIHCQQAVDQQQVERVARQPELVEVEPSQRAA